MIGTKPGGRYKRVPVSTELVAAMLYEGVTDEALGRYSWTCVEGLPADARLCDVFIDHEYGHRLFVFIFEHPDWDECAEGQLIPVLHPTYRRDFTPDRSSDG